MKKLIARLLSHFFRAISDLINASSNWVAISKSTVLVGNNLKIKGKIIIKNEGKITLGNNVLINNHSSYNPVGLPHQTILATLNASACIHIGDGVGISGASIVAAQKVIIGNNVLIGGGVGIWDTDFHPLSASKRNIHRTKEAKSSPVIIGNSVFIGARAIILKGVTIGDGAVIAASSVVNNDVPEGYLCFGNPMQLINKNYT